jgi:pyrroloquinoline quinone biosynthesis protein D
MKPENIPHLSRGCRLSEDPERGWILLIPEGVLQLSGPGPLILQRCDGARTFAEIVRDLESQFPGSETGRIENETAAFLEKLQERRIVVVE